MIFQDLHLHCIWNNCKLGYYLFEAGKWEISFRSESGIHAQSTVAYIKFTRILTKYHRIARIILWKFIECVPQKLCRISSATTSILPFSTKSVSCFVFRVQFHSLWISDGISHGVTLLGHVLNEIWIILEPWRQWCHYNYVFITIR